MRSRPLYPDYAYECTWKYRSLSSISRNQGHVKRGQFLYRCLLLVEGFIKVMNGLLLYIRLTMQNLIGREHSINSQ